MKIKKVEVMVRQRRMRMGVIVRQKNDLYNGGLTWFLGTVVLTFLVTMVQVSYTHVGLTFPPARKYDLDFLDNVRTKPPCGMPKGSVKTTLISGSSINVTWHLSYPHQGGYRLELMDAQEKEILDLTPRVGTNDYIRGDPTAQWYSVKLPPSFTCTDCTVRLLREASEWSGKYRFWSCADVSIVEPKDYKESCFGHGRSIAGRCVCNKGFWGNRCQYEDECETEKECTNGNGQCIDLGGTALPRKQCFCNPGFHGEKCSKRNLVRLPDSKKTLDLTQHTKRILSDRMTLYYKLIPSKSMDNKEIEFVLVIDGTSYGAIGWRPTSFSKSCQRWPFIANSTITSGSGGGRQGKNGNGFGSSSSKENLNVVVVPEPEAKPEVGAEPEAKPEVGAEPEAKPEVGTESEAKPEGEAEPTVEGEPVAENESKSGSSKVSKDPHKNHKYSSKPEAETESEPETAAEPKPEGEAEPVAEGEPQPKTSEPEATTIKIVARSNAAKLKSNIKPKPVLLTDDTQDVSLESSSITVSRSSRKQRSSKPQAEPQPEGEPQPESEPQPENEPQPEGEPSNSSSEPEPNAGSEPEGEPNGSGSGTSHHDYNPSVLQPHEWAPRNDFHAMDCIDLVMGGARGQLSRILDYYTRDRSTPRLDSFWGGQNDLTSATGWEKGNTTTLIFRRKIRSTDGSDHALDSGEMHVIWARGQESGDYVHKPKSGLEAAGHMPSIPSFYAPDEIKYHGHGSQRGKTKINFVEVVESTSTRDTSNCEDGWKHPPGCSNEDPKFPCTYSAKWRYIPNIDSLQFTIQSRKSQRWTGIGFGDSPTMRNSDAILGWVTAAGRFFIMDAFMPSYVSPVLDATQNIKNETGTIVDGIITLSFIRPIETSDMKDISLDKCRFFIFPTEGGTYDAVSKKLGKHDHTPLTSAERICISRQCRPIILKKPDEIRYIFDIKLIGGFANNWIPPIKGSPDFDEFNNRLRRDLESQLKKIDGFNRLQLTEVKKTGNQAVATLELMVKPNSELAEMVRVDRVLKETISTGRAGNLQVDPTYLKLGSPEVFKSENNEEKNTEGLYPSLIGTRLWIVIGCVSALILLALVQAILTLYKTSGKTSSHKQDTPSSGSGMAWRDYSETNYGYDGYDEKGLTTNNGNTMPLRATPIHHQPNYHYNGQGGGGGGGGHSQITNLSLPRPQSQSRSSGGGVRHHLNHNSHLSGHLQNGHSSTNGGHGTGTSTTALSQNNPDFYFMPSQRKYSGEVVRVFVDHNNKR